MPTRASWLGAGGLDRVDGVDRADRADGVDRVDRVDGVDGFYSAARAVSPKQQPAFFQRSRGTLFLQLPSMRRSLKVFVLL